LLAEVEVVAVLALLLAALVAVAMDETGQMLLLELQTLVVAVAVLVELLQVFTMVAQVVLAYSELDIYVLR
jgi:hypothetical protein